MLDRALLARGLDFVVIQTENGSSQFRDFTFTDKDN